jgi:hypothetical protein
MAPRGTKQRSRMLQLTRQRAHFLVPEYRYLLLVICILPVFIGLSLCKGAALAVATWCVPVLSFPNSYFSV